MKFTIADTDYSLKTNWNDVVLQDAVAIVELDYSEEVVDACIDGIEFGEQEYNYIVDVLVVLTNTPKDILHKTEPLYLEVLFQYIRHLIKDLFYFDVSNYKPIGITEIKFKGRKFMTPSHIKIDDEIILCYKEPAKNITEASNLMTYMSDMKTKGLGVMKYVCALYLKEIEGETYDDDRVKERADLFDELPMTVVWDVFFYTYNSFTSSALNTIICLRREQEVVNKVKLKIWVILIGCLLLLKQGWQVILKKLRK